MSALSYNQRKYTVCVCFYIQSSLSLGIYLGTVSVLAYVWTFSLSPSFDPEALVQLKQTRTPPVSCPIPGCSLEHQSACCPSHQRSYSKRLHLYSHMVQRSTKRNIRRDSKCAIMVETGTFVKQHWKKNKHRKLFTCVALLLDRCEGPMAMLTLDDDCVSVVLPPSAAERPEITKPLEKLRFPKRRLRVEEDEETWKTHY